jgi:excisionase family DNA binding protein
VTATTQQPQDALMTVQEVASYLNVTERTIRQWVADKKIPHRRLGSKGPVRFFRREVDKWSKGDGDQPKK